MTRTTCWSLFTTHSRPAHCRTRRAEKSSPKSRQRRPIAGLKSHTKSGADVTSKYRGHGHSQCTRNLQIVNVSRTRGKCVSCETRQQLPTDGIRNVTRPATGIGRWKNRIKKNIFGSRSPRKFVRNRELFLWLIIRIIGIISPSEWSGEGNGRENDITWGNVRLFYGGIYYYTWFYDFYYYFYCTLIL